MIGLQVNAEINDKCNGVYERTQFKISEAVLKNTTL